MTKNIIFAVVLFLATPAWATIVTDRPDVTESPLVVPKNSIQIETGVDVSNIPAIGLTDVGLPTKLRVGIVDAVEFHLESPLVRVRNSIVGFGAIDIGTKLTLLDRSEGPTPALGLLFALSIPTANRLGGNRVGISAKAAGAWDLEGISISANAGLQSGFFFLAGVVVPWSVSLGVPLGDKLSVFIESFGVLALVRDIHSIGLDGGLTYLLRDDLQFDAYVRSSYNGNFSIGGGLGVSYVFGYR